MIVRLAIAALFGILLVTYSPLGGRAARAADEPTQIASTSMQPAPMEFAGISPSFDLTRFDNESVLRAVFMTAVLGFVVLGRSTGRRERVENNVRPSTPFVPMAGLPPLDHPASLAATVSRVLGANDDVVWMNTRTGVVHEKGSRWFGKTREGEYVPRQQLRSEAPRAVPALTFAATA